MEVKTFSGELDLRQVDGKPEGRFKAQICQYNTPDKGGDVVLETAFTEDLQRRRARKQFIPVAFNHEITDPDDVIGEVSPFDTQSTSTGLIVSGRFFISDNARAAKVHALLKRGTIRDWSFGCYVRASRPRQGGGGREFQVLDLFEVSPVIIGKGTTDTILVNSATGRAPSPPLTSAELLGPYRSRLDVWTQRIARRRAHGG